MTKVEKGRRAQRLRKSAAGDPVAARRALRRTIARGEKELRRILKKRTRCVRAIVTAQQTVALLDAQVRDLAAVLVEADRRLAHGTPGEPLAGRDGLAAQAARDWYAASLRAYRLEDILVARERRQWFATLLRTGLVTKYAGVNIEKVLNLLDGFWHAGRYADDVRLLREWTADEIERMPALLERSADFLDAGRATLADRLASATYGSMQNPTPPGARPVLDFVTVLVGREKVIDQGDAKTRDARLRSALARELERIAGAVRAVAAVTRATPWRGARFGGPEGPPLVRGGRPKSTSPTSAATPWTRSRRSI
jgi:hypothetical protein